MHRRLDPSSCETLSFVTVSPRTASRLHAATCLFARGVRGCGWRACVRASVQHFSVVRTEPARARAPGRQPPTSGRTMAQARPPRGRSATWRKRRAHRLRRSKVNRCFGATCQGRSVSPLKTPKRCPVPTGATAGPRLEWRLSPSQPSTMPRACSRQRRASRARTLRNCKP